MDERSGDGDRPLRVRLEVHLDRQPIRGLLRTDQGDEESFTGWLGFVDALRRVQQVNDVGGR
jgi:hypothetical protein